MMEKYRLLFKYIKANKAWGILSLISGLLSTAAKLFIPFLAGKTITLFANKEFTSPLVSRNLIIIAICLVFLLVFRYLFEYSSNLLAQKITKSLKDDLFNKYLNLPISEIDQKGSGELISRLINDVDQVQNGLIIGGSTLYDGIIAIIIIIGFMFSLNWLLAVLVILLSPLSLFAGRYLSTHNSQHFKKQANANGELAAFTLESLSHSEDIKSNNLEEYRYQQFVKINNNHKNALFKANLSSSTINPLTRLINALINASIILVGALLIVNKTEIGVIFGVGELIAFITYANSYTQPFNDISNVASEISFANSSLRRIEEMMNLVIEENQENKTLNEIEGINFNHVYFSYPNNKREIIKDFDFKIKKGQKIALVGPTGCGKTTMINLLMRFYHLNSGEIIINQNNIVNYQKTNYYQKLGMVLQESVIFPGTIKENIAYGKKEASIEEIKIASQKAHLYDLVNKMKDGYDTYIDDHTSLSLGEKQLICIARIMLLNPEVIILDEATSNIDIRSEVLLNQSLYELTKGKTSIVVAHRLSTIQSSDQIIVMNEGQIIEVGKHEELLKKKGFYYQLFNAQFN